MNSNQGKFGMVFPKTESRSLIIHGPGVCPYAKCSYCPMFSEDKTKPFDLREFEEYVRSEARSFQLEEISSIFISEGNTISLEPKMLNSILKILYFHFPFLKGVSAYGSAKAVLNRTSKQLASFLRNGLTRIHMGLESGSDDVLRLLKKGVDKEGMLEAATIIKKAGFELHLYVMIGAAGTELSGEHVKATAEAVNEITPSCVDFQTLVPIPHTPLTEEAQEKRFTFLSPHGTIREIRAFIEEIDTTVEINCSHVSNHCHVRGDLPDDRARLLSELDYSLSLDESLFDNSGIANIELPS